MARERHAPEAARSTVRGARVEGERECGLEGSQTVSEFGELVVAGAAVARGQTAADFLQQQDVAGGGKAE